MTDMCNSTDAIASKKEEVIATGSGSKKNSLSRKLNKIIRNWKGKLWKLK